MEIDEADRMEMEEPAAEEQRSIHLLRSISSRLKCGDGSKDVVYKKGDQGLGW